MNEMMSEMREMMEKRIKKVVKKLVEKMGVSEEELIKMLEDTEYEKKGRANGVESLVSVSMDQVADPIVLEEPVKKTRAPPKKKEPELDANGEPVKKTRAPPKKKEPELDANGEPVKKTRAPPKKKEVELDENGEPVKKTRAPPKKKEPVLDENGEPVKKTRAPPKKKEPELDANGEPVKKTRAPAKKKEPELDANGEPVKKTRAPAKRAPAKGVESLVSMMAEEQVVSQEKTTGTQASKRAPAKGVESLVSMEEIVVAKVELDEYDSDAETIKLPESDSESDANLEYDEGNTHVMRVVIKGVAYLYDENLNAYHEGTKTFVGKYEPELGEISVLDMESVSELGDSDDECPALSV